MTLLLQRINKIDYYKIYTKKMFKFSILKMFKFSKNNFSTSINNMLI